MQYISIQIANYIVCLVWKPRKSVLIILAQRNN